MIGLSLKELPRIQILPQEEEELIEALITDFYVREVEEEEDDELYDFDYSFLDDLVISMRQD